jgi:hypothetical protein
MRALCSIAVLALAASCASVSGAAPRGGPVPQGYRLVRDEPFAPPAALWRSIPSAWRVDERGALELVEPEGGESYAPPHRSPLRLALLPELTVGSFVLELEMQQTGREYGHRDLCLVFGFRSPVAYYYAHLATTPDEHACNVFLVDDAPRRRIADVPEQGVEWGTDVWHAVRLERDVEVGTIRVFFDDMRTPVLETLDRTHGRGHLGFGSFDDTGAFRSVRVWAPHPGPALLAGDPFAGPLR